MLRLTLLFCLLIVSPAWAAPAVAPKDFAVASAHPLATEAGIRVLQDGGNAFDAAITVAAVLGVVEPYSAGIGGGGFWLVQKGGADKPVFIDARETAPASAKADLYVNAKGEVDRDLATNTALAAGIPGQPAAFVHLAKEYGKLPLSRTLAPAIELAEKGFTLNPVYRALAEMRAPVLKRYADSQRIFLDSGKPLTDTTRILQPELAGTLKRLADQGHTGFYDGELAQKLVDGVKAGGGIWSLDDLKHYKVVEREPIRFDYQGATVWSAPPPSSGGIALGQMFGMLGEFNLGGRSDIDRAHLLIEVMRRAYRDRAIHLGDPDFHPVPVAKLLDEQYLQDLAADISGAHATPSKNLGGAVPPPSGPHTTHLSVIDRQGNRVAATLSINLPFGSGYTVPGTGVLLNNEMDDFSAQPGSPNAYGLIGSEANAIAPGKRPLSSMTPTFMEYGPADNRQLAILGTPGGSRIITMVFLGLLEALDGKGPQLWVDRPRFHHQFLPDVVEYEPEGFKPAFLQGLEQKGHVLKDTGRAYGDMQVIHWQMKNGSVEAAADKRRVGSAHVGPLR
jgi:gamma-glutamyltranspeptidase/glutathione hydrolase